MKWAIHFRCDRVMLTMEEETRYPVSGVDLPRTLVPLVRRVIVWFLALGLVSRIVFTERSILLDLDVSEVIGRAILLCGRSEVTKFGQAKRVRC